VAQFVQAEVVGYIPQINFLTDQGVTVAALQDFRTWLEHQGQHEAAITVGDFIKTQGLVDVKGRASKRAIDLYVIAAIISHRDVPDYKDLPSDASHPFYQLGLASITTDLLVYEGILHWPSPIRNNQLIFLEDHFYYHPLKLVLRGALERLESHPRPFCIISECGLSTVSAIPTARSNFLLGCSSDTMFAG
jgi:hypothetical protein